MSDLGYSDGLRGRYIPTAVYFADSDCIEYSRRDSFCIYERVDEFLTLIYDRNRMTLIGLKLKGFKHIFDTKLKALFKLNDEQFLELIQILEAVVTQIGDRITSGDEKVKNAYRAALDLVANDNVKLQAAFLRPAA